MAKKTVSRKQLRAEAEAAEAKEPKDAKKKAVKKKAVKKRRGKSKDPEDLRLKIFWGVYNQAAKRVAKYDFNQKKAAQKKAEELSVDGKPHFVQKDKEPVEEV